MYSTSHLKSDSQARIYRRMGMRRLPVSPNKHSSPVFEKDENDANCLKSYSMIDSVIVDSIGHAVTSLRSTNHGDPGNAEYLKFDECHLACTADLIQVVSDLLYKAIPNRAECTKELIESSIANVASEYLKSSRSCVADFAMPKSRAAEELDATTPKRISDDAESHCILSSADRNVSAKEDARNICILVIGLDGAGKTTLVSSLKGNGCHSCKPTLGFCPVLMSYEDSCTVHLFDIGGGAKIRGIWKNYFYDVHGVIYVFDVDCDVDKFEESISVARQTLSHLLLRNKPLLLICNRKEGERNARSCDFVQESILEYLNINTTVSYVDINLHDSTATAQLSLERKVEWLIKCILENFEYLSDRVAKDTEVNAKQIIADQMEKERRALKTMMCKAFGAGGESKVETFNAGEAAQFLATELGLESTALPKEASELAALVGYEKYALMIIGAMACPVSRKKKAWTWSELKQYVQSIKDEIFPTTN